jgi:hypothetical protein
VPSHVIIALGIFLCIVIPSLYLAYLIGLKKKIHLVAGSQARRMSHPIQYAYLISQSLIYMSVILAATSFLIGNQILHFDHAGLPIIVALAIPMSMGTYATVKYGRKPKI